jgi:hypothetical protein
MRRLIIEYGEALHGSRWLVPLAGDLRCSARTLQRWASGQEKAPATLLPSLQKLADVRIIALCSLRQRFSTSTEHEAL